jgi:hypothetical protein
MTYRRTTLAIALAALWLAAATAAEAKTFTVANGFSRGPGTLARAIEKADKHRGRDTIRFGEALRGREIDVERPLTIHDAVKILGEGRKGPTLTGPVDGTQIRFHKTGPKRSYLDHLRLDRVRVKTRGDGAVLTLVLTRLDGGGTANGTGLHSLHGLRVVASKITGFQTSGIFSGDAKISRSTITKNGYAGLHVFGQGATIDSSTFSGNAVGIVAVTSDQVEVTNSTLSGNGNTTFQGSSAVFADATDVTIQSSTIANTVTPMPDPVFIDDGRAALRAEYGGRIEVTNSILSGSTYRDCWPGPRSDIVFAGGNVLDEAVDCSPSGADVVADPHLEPLAANGGWTRTHAIGPGSPAIGFATDPAPNRDQRGFNRGPDPDSGAFEAQPAQ